MVKNTTEQRVLSYQEKIFYEERNYQYFLKLYARYIEPVADTYAYCLLSNHFHFSLYIKTKEEQEQTFRVSETLNLFFAHYQKNREQTEAVEKR